MYIYMYTYTYMYVCVYVYIYVMARYVRHAETRAQNGLEFQSVGVILLRAVGR